MRHSTKDLHEKYVSGHTLDEISQATGIGKWALYKRFQRMKRTESSQNNSKDNETQENIMSCIDKSQTRATKWTDAMYALLVFTAIVSGFFLYRKYHTEKPSKEAK